MGTNGAHANESIEDFFDNAAHAMHWVAADGTIVRANAFELRALGYEHDEYVGRHIAEFHADPDRIADILARLGRNETLRDYPARLRAKDGSIRHVLINSNVRWSADGEFLHTRCFTRDVTDSVLAEEAVATATAELERTIGERTAELERQREQLEEAQRIAHLGSWEWTLASDRIEASEEFLNIFGLPRGAGELTQSRFEALVHPDDRELRRRALERGVQSEEPFAFDLRIVRPDGETRFLHVRARADLGLDGTPQRLFGTVQDRTESRLLEDERLHFERSLQETQRLESLGVLAGGIAHDFNNLLVGVLGNASLALAELPPGSPARARIEDVELASRRAGELTQQLLAYSGQGSFVVQPIDLVDLIEEMGQLLETVLSKQVCVAYEFGAEHPVVEIDATQLRQVVMNLIVNASDACGNEPGSIHVHVRTVDADRAYLDSFRLADALPQGELALIEVTDTGLGMSSATKDKLFDPFYTTKVSGRGLGLAGVLGIVRVHGGAIRVESEPGRGSTFTILFPLSRLPLPAASPVDAETQLSTRSGTVLIADDEFVIREVARAMLTNAGFTVLTAENGDEAVALFREREDEIDAAVLDLTMPGRGGAEVLKDLRAVRPDLPVVISSGYTAAALDGSAGEVGFVQKPYTNAQLVNAVCAALGAGPARRGTPAELAQR